MVVFYIYYRCTTLGGRAPCGNQLKKNFARNLLGWLKLDLVPEWSALAYEPSTVKGEMKTGVPYQRHTINTNVTTKVSTSVKLLASWSVQNGGIICAYTW